MRALMIQGAGSNVGKSLLVAGLCRAARIRGLKVAPFKPQNMSNNAAVTADGGEIGRAQALQALACGLEPHTDMNPILLKPESEMGSQVIVQGRRLTTVKAREYSALKPKLMAPVLESFERLKASVDLVIVEGAGSPAEVNLRPRDIANMGFARAADVPVVLVGDIDRGGVIAQIVGTQAVIDPDDAAMIAGFVINKFRGDPAIVRRWLRVHRRADQMARLWRAAVLCRGCSASGRGRTRSAARRRRRRLSCRRAAILSYRQFRRSRSAVAGAGCQPHHGAAGRGDTGRYRSRDPAGIEIDARRSGFSARARLGHRSRRACQARRSCARHLRRLPDAGPHHQRSRWDRRPGRRNCWSWLA